MPNFFMSQFAIGKNVEVYCSRISWKVKCQSLVSCQSTILLLCLARKISFHIGFSRFFLIEFTVVMHAAVYTKRSRRCKAR